MAKKEELSRAGLAFVAALVLLTFAAGLLGPQSALAAKPAPPPDSAALQMQALVMDMADTYIAALGESVYLLTRSGKLDSKGRWLAQSFLRNGVGASLDIAVGPNPSVNLLDLLVLTSLQAWSFKAHWMPAGIGDAGIPALKRLKEAEADLWTSAGKNLSQDQLNTLRALIDAWIAQNPNRTVVALVRFEEFVDERKVSSQSLRGRAQGLLKEVSEAIAVVDDARLLGERLLWYAGRYPYLLGEQTELTAYRLIDQPEGAQLMEAVKSANRLSETLTEHIGTIQGDLEKQQKAFFSKVSAERSAAIKQLEERLTATMQKMLDHASESVQIQRQAAINQLFDRFGQERTMLLDDLASRQSEFLDLTTELSKTISVSGTLAKELTETVNAIDRVVGRFDRDPEGKQEPLRMTDVRDTAIETGRAAAQLKILLEQALELLESKAWDQRMAVMLDPAAAIIDRAFWRGVLLILLLIAGLGLLRWVPQRTTAIRSTNQKG